MSEEHVGLGLLEFSLVLVLPELLLVFEFLKLHVLHIVLFIAQGSQSCWVLRHVLEVSLMFAIVGVLDVVETSEELLSGGLVPVHLSDFTLCELLVFDFLHAFVVHSFLLLS